MTAAMSQPISTSKSLSNIRAKVTVLKHQNEYANLNEKFQAIVGGFGSGKSEAGVYRTLRLMKTRKYCKMLLVAPTYSLLQDVNIPSYEDMFQKYRIKYQYVKSQRKIIVNQGELNGEIMFRSADRPERIVGFECTDFQIDEFDILPPEKQRELWRKVIARARGCADTTGGITTTAEGFRETYELFEKRHIGPIIKARTEDNTFLPADYIATLYDQYDEQLVKQYILGEFVNINGMQAYYGFDRDKNHLTNDAFQDKHGIEISKIGEVCVGMDFNVRKMCAEVFVHIKHKRIIHFFDELLVSHPGHSDKTQTEIMCDVIKTRYPDKRINVYPDASGRHRETSALQSDIATLEQAGLKVYANKANPAVRDRLNAANTMLGKVRATVDVERCPDLVEDLEKCQRDKYGEVDKKDENRTHSSDAATYPMVYLYPIAHKRSVKQWEI